MTLRRLRTLCDGEWTEWDLQLLVEDMMTALNSLLEPGRLYPDRRNQVNEEDFQCIWIDVEWIARLLRLLLDSTASRTAIVDALLEITDAEIQEIELDGRLVPWELDSQH